MRSWIGIMIVAGLSLAGSCDKDDDDAVAPPAPPAPGALDPAFGTGGVITSSPSVGTPELTATALAGGYLYVGGTDYGAGGTDIEWRIEKRSAADGSLVAAFGTSGVVNSNPSADFDVLFGLAVDSVGGALYAVGTDQSISNPDTQWRIEKRDLVTGALVAGFGTGGVVLSNPSSAVDEAKAIVLDTTHIFVGGFDRVLSAVNGRWRIEKRDLATGALDAGFGTAGVVTTSPSIADDTVYALLRVGVFLFVGGDDFNPGTLEARVEKRSASDGSIVGTFGGSGAALHNTGQADTVRGLAFDGFSLFTYTVTNYSIVKVMKYNFTDGGLVTAFGTLGTLTLAFPFEAPMVNFLSAPAPFAIADTTLYVGGSENQGGLYRNRLDARDTTSGALVASFGSGGTVTSDPSTEEDGYLRVETDATSLYAAGMSLSNSGNDSQWRIEKRGR